MCIWVPEKGVGARKLQGGGGPCALAVLLIRTEEPLTKNAQRTKDAEKENDRKKCFMVWEPALSAGWKNSRYSQRDPPLGKRPLEKQR